MSTYSTEYGHFVLSTSVISSRVRGERECKVRPSSHYSSTFTEQGGRADLGSVVLAFKMIDDKIFVRLVKAHDGYQVNVCGRPLNVKDEWVEYTIDFDIDIGDKWIPYEGGVTVHIGSDVYYFSLKGEHGWKSTATTTTTVTSA